MTYASGILTTSAYVGSTSTAPVASLTITDTSAATQLEASRLKHTTSATTTIGIGVYQSMFVPSAAGTAREAGRIMASLRNVTDAGETGVLTFSTINAGTLAVTANSAFTTSGTMYGTVGLGIGSISATSVVANTALISIVSSMVNYASSLATQGGHSFTGTTNTSGTRSFMVITPSSNTGATAGTPWIGHDWQTHTHQYASNTTVATHKEFSIAAPTVAFASATGTVTDAATLFVSGAPIVGTNAAITRGYAAWFAGATRIDSVAANGSVATAMSSVGPVGSHTTVQEWLVININGVDRYFAGF
jgi:hypothetical protein